VITALIPARGGSKGIRNKNIVPVCGKPLLAWTIEQALDSPAEQVIVLTDSREIGEVAHEFGADWLPRGDATATDTAQTEACLLEWLECQAKEPNLIIFLQATSPIRQPDDLRNAVAQFETNGCDSMFSARVLDGYTWSVCREVRPNYHNRQRRQIQDVVRLEENGSFYIFKPKVLRHYRSRLGGTVDYFEQHPLDSYQVDTYEDLALMQQLIPLRLQCELSAT